MALQISLGEIDLTEKLTLNFTVMLQTIFDRCGEFYLVIHFVPLRSWTINGPIRRGFRWLRSARIVFGGIFFGSVQDVSFMLASVRK
jgi:hypothetical protein